MRIESLPASSTDAVPTDVMMVAKAQERLKAEGKAAVQLIENAAQTRPPAADGTGRAVDVLA